MPEGVEPDGFAESDDEEDDELDVSKPRQFGKQGKRERAPPTRLDYFVDPTHVELEQSAPAAASR